MIRIEPDGTRTASHAPGADLDYAVDWSNWLATGETIQTSTWTAENGITLSRQSILDGKVAVAFAAGGIAKRRYTLTNTITTTAGRTDSRSITLRVHAR